jgi:peptide deformylase
LNGKLFINYLSPLKQSIVKRKLHKAKLKAEVRPI